MIEMATASGLVLVPSRPSRRPAGLDLRDRRADPRGDPRRGHSPDRRDRRERHQRRGRRDGPGPGVPAPRRRRFRPPPGRRVARPARPDRPPEADLLLGVEVSVACDVENPLCGPTGASRVYGPAEGGDPDQVEMLDRNLARFAAIIRRDLGRRRARTSPARARRGGWARADGVRRGGLGPGVSLVIEAVKPGRATPGGRPLPDRRRGRSTAPAPSARRPSAWRGWPGRSAAPRSPWPARSARGPRTSCSKGSTPLAFAHHPAAIPPPSCSKLAEHAGLPRGSSRPAGPRIDRPMNPLLDLSVTVTIRPRSSIPRADWTCGPRGPTAGRASPHGVSAGLFARQMPGLGRASPAFSLRPGT